MPTPRDLLNEAKKSIREVDQADTQALLEGGGVTFLDVREPDEYEQGALPNAVHLPRGHLEFQVKGKLPDKEAPIVVYCAGGVRSAFAAKTLGDLGYTDVQSMIGGFNKWKDDDRPWSAPQTLTPAQRNRYQRHLLLPEVGEVGQLKLLGSKVLLLGGRPRIARRPLPGGGRRRHHRHHRHGCRRRVQPPRQILHNMDRIGDRKVDSAKKTLTALNPDVNVVTYDVRLGADNILDIIDGYDVIVDGTDNFPTRYLVNDASLLKRIPVIHGSIFRFEGQVTVFDPSTGPATAASSPAAAGRAGSLVFGGGGPRCAARHHRVNPGRRDDQGAARAWGPVDRTAAVLRRPRRVVPDVQGAPGPGLPGLRTRRG